MAMPIKKAANYSLNKEFLPKTGVLVQNLLFCKSVEFLRFNWKCTIMKTHFTNNLFMSLCQKMFTLPDPPSFESSLLQGDKKNMPIGYLFFREIIQPNLPKFAYDLIRERRVRIWSQILTISIASVPKSRLKFLKNGKNRFIRFSSFSVWVKLILCMKNVSKQLQCVITCPNRKWTLSSYGK